MEDQEGTVVEEGTPSEGTPEVQGTQELDQIRAELEQARSQLEERDKQYKTLQKTHSKTAEEARTAKVLADTISRLNERIDDLELNQAVTLDELRLGRNQEYLEGDQRQVAQSAQERLKAERETRKQKAEMERLQQESFNNQVKAFGEALAEAGLSLDDPETKDALVKGADSPLESMKRIPAYLKKVDKAQKEAEAKRLAEEAKAKERQEAAEKGETVFPGQSGHTAPPSNKRKVGDFDKAAKTAKHPRDLLAIEEKELDW